MRVSLVMAAALLVVTPLVSLVTFPAAKSLETAYMPVVEDMKFIQTVSEKAGGVTFEVFGIKVRDCTLLSLYPLVLVEGEWTRGEFSSTAGPVTPALSRPKGRQYFGNWTIVPSGESVRFVAKHKCNSLWDTTTELGTITIQ